MLDELGREDQIRKLLSRRCYLSNGLHLSRSLYCAVGLLSQHTTEHRAVRPAGIDGLLLTQEDAVLLAFEDGERLGFEVGSDEHLEEELVDLASRRHVDGAVGYEHATEGGDGVTCQRICPSLEEGGARGAATSVVVLEDGEGGLSEVLDE